MYFSTWYGFSLPRYSCTIASGSHAICGKHPYYFFVFTVKAKNRERLSLHVKKTLKPSSAKKPFNLYKPFLTVVQSSTCVARNHTETSPAFHASFHQCSKQANLRNKITRNEWGESWNPMKALTDFGQDLCIFCIRPKESHRISARYGKVFSTHLYDRGHSHLGLY